MVDSAPVAEPVNVTVTAHPDNWANILSAIFQGITVLGPFVIQLIEAAEGAPSTVMVHQLPKAMQ